jgi:hypothetical protein
MMYHFLPVVVELMAFLLTVPLSKKIEDVGDPVTEKEVNQSQVKSKKEDGHNNDDRGSVDFFLGRPRHFLQFGLDVAVEIDEISWRFLNTLQHMIADFPFAARVRLGS